MRKVADSVVTKLREEKVRQHRRLVEAALKFADHVSAPGEKALHKAGPALGGWVIEAFVPVAKAWAKKDVADVALEERDPSLFSANASNAGYIETYYQALSRFARSAEGHRRLASLKPKDVQKIDALRGSAASFRSVDDPTVVDSDNLFADVIDSIIFVKLLGGLADPSEAEYPRKLGSLFPFTGKLLPHPKFGDYDPEYVSKFGDDMDPDARDDCFYKSMIQRLKQMARDKDWDSIPSAAEFERDIKKCHLSAADASRVRKVWTEIVDAMPARNPRRRRSSAGGR
jgi:hypothetical protein